MEESIVKVEHLSHRYSVQWAIKDINFEIKNKGTLGLLGSNGAGKSTTMNILTGYLSSTSGEVKIDGLDILDDHVWCSQSNRRGGIYKWYQSQGTSGRGQEAHRFSPAETSSIPGSHGG